MTTKISKKLSKQLKNVCFHALCVYTYCDSELFSADTFYFLGAEFLSLGQRGAGGFSLILERMKPERRW
jgi:hypothetical protein